MADKEELEKRKLQAEISEIELRVDSARRKFESDKQFLSKASFGTWAAIIISFITIVTGGLTIGEKLYVVLSQNERVRQVKIDKEMIEIVKELKSDDPITMKNNILLLSAYEIQAVPILLANVEFSDNPEIIIGALKSIKNKKGINVKEFSSIVMGRAQEVFRTELQKLPRNGETITIERASAEKHISNYIKLLAEMNGEESEEVLITWKEVLLKRTPPVEDKILAGLSKILDLQINKK